MADHSRLYDGFDELSRGMDGGRAPTQILKTQVAAAVNTTFRGEFAKTRPPYWKRNLTYESAETRARWTGIFQGAVFYESDNPAHIVSRGGRLFRIEANETNLVTEITPQLTMTVTAEFTVPAIGLTVLVSVVSETVFTVGQTVIIDSGNYTVTNRFANALLLTYNGGAANATVAEGAAITDVNGDPIFEIRENPSTLDFIYLFQAENYVIVLAGPQRTVIYDGSSSRLAAIAGEVPSGVLGIYVWGRIWIVLPDGRTFVAGDLRNTTTLSDFSDILKFTENDFYNEGGTFGVPYNVGKITGLQSLATQDTSLGQGNLLVGTRNSVFSVNTPVDRTTWKNLRYPIQTVALIDYGPEAPRCVPQVNGDMWYRSQDGFRSFITARRDIQVWGNTPMGREVEPLTELDTENLLYYASGILFDNRFISTVSPFKSDIGVAHRGLAVLNFDLVSSIQGKSLPAWDGAWSGLDVLQLTKGNEGRIEKGFAWVANDTCLELWEIKRSKDGKYDQTVEYVDNAAVITRVPIQSSMETRQMDFESRFNLKELRMADLFIDQIVDNVTVTIKWRPDEYPAWVTWATISFCANVSQCSMQASEGVVCTIWKPRAAQYAARIRLPKPPEDCNDIAGITLDRGYEFQFRIEWTGSLRYARFRPNANILSQETEGQCPPEVVCKTFEDCGTSWFDYDAMPMCS